MSWATIIAVLHYGIAAMVALRVMLKPRLAASARLAWVLVIEALPLVGILAWILFGEVRMHRADRQRAADVREAIAQRWVPSRNIVRELPQPARTVTAQALASGGLHAVSGNRLQLLSEDDEAIEDIARAIDQARRSVVVLFYIWLDDVSGQRIARACGDAARRGVSVRVIVDALGSRRFLRSRAWASMRAAGVDTAEAFPLGNALIRPLTGRMDLRNHRKIVVIDGCLGFTGSRNCADMAFSAKPRFAPWVDVMFRVEGPAVRQLELIFVQDWLSASKKPLEAKIARLLPPQPVPDAPCAPPASENAPSSEAASGLAPGTEIAIDMADPPPHWALSDTRSSDLQARAAMIAPLLPPVRPAGCPGQVVQVVPTGPNDREGSLSDVVATLIHSAREKLIITTPYYVPDETTDAAIRAAARRGVAVTLILPERNDSRLVQAVSEGFHSDLLRAGVRIMLFRGGLIHAKIISVDGGMALAGSANLDRRSFDLNFEISLLVVDHGFTSELDARQQSYIDRARPLTRAEVRGRPALRRLRGNIASLAAPLL